MSLSTSQSGLLRPTTNNCSSCCFLVVAKSISFLSNAKQSYSQQNIDGRRRVMVVSAKKNEEEEEEGKTTKTKRKQNLFESVTEALDFAQVRSEADAQLLDDAREATKSGSKMCRAQIFSNANDAHVAIILNILGLEDCFERIVCFETLNPTNISNELQAADAASDSDSTTESVGSSHRAQGIDYALESIHNIREALPELWEELERADGVPYSRKSSIETVVRA